jgi:uncharacterized membrane protein
MTFDDIPVTVIFLATIAIVASSLEAGYLLGYVSKGLEKEKDSPVSGISGSILGLLAFMLAFTFGIVSDRFEARKGLVREEANAIGTAFLRTALLPEPDRTRSAELYRKYVDIRVAAVASRDMQQVAQAMKTSVEIQDELWSIAVARSREGTNAPITALYVDALNKVIDLHSLRIAVGLQSRVPGGVWLTLYSLIVLAMTALGYQTFIAGSRRTWASVLLALSFSLVITLIALIDRPEEGFVPVSQQPMIDLKASMRR